MSQFKTVVLVAVSKAADDVLCVRVEQQFVRVEAMPGVGLVGAVGAIAVDQTGPCSGQKTVKHAVVRTVHGIAAQFAGAAAIEYAELDLFGVLGEHCEVQPMVAHACAQRVRAAGQQAAGECAGHAGSRNTLAKGGKLISKDRAWP